MAGSYFALDLSSNTGWAKWSPTTGYESGEFEVSGKSLGAYALSFSRWLAPKLIGVTDCWIEDLFIGKQTGSETIIKLAGLRWESAKSCQQRGIACQTVALPSWRSHFIGTSVAPKGTPKGKGPDWLKKRAVEECRKRGWTPRTHNEAEALGILDFMRCKLDRDYGSESTPLFRSA